MLLRQLTVRAFSRACAKTGKRIAARIAIMAMTTSSSISVKAKNLVRFMTNSFVSVGSFLSALGLSCRLDKHKTLSVGTLCFFAKSVYGYSRALPGVGLCDALTPRQSCQIGIDTLSYSFLVSSVQAQ